MGRRRRFVQLDDDDDDDEADNDEKDLEAMRRAEEEERRELEADTKTRRRRGFPKRRRDPEREEEEKEPEEVESQEEEPREEENTEAVAVPVAVGDPVKISGKGRKQKKHYASFEYGGDTYELDDPVMLSPEDISERPYVAILKDITETEGCLYVTAQWLYRPEEPNKKEGGCWVPKDTRELFYSFHKYDVLAESIMHKCVVHFIPQHKQIPSPKQLPGFIVQKVYDADEKKLRNLTDKDYEDDKQQEIDLLVERMVPPNWML